MFAIYQRVTGSTEWQFVKAVPIAGLLVGRILEEARTDQPNPKGSMA